MTENRSAPPGAVVPVLIYDDVPRAIEWLCAAFGFAERLRAGDSHAQIQVGSGSVMLGAQRQGQGFGDDRAAFRTPRPQEVSQYVHVKVDDVDGHYARAVRQGVTILHPPTDQMFGERQYTAADLAGHRWTFSQSIADIDPKEWGAVPPGTG